MAFSADGKLLATTADDTHIALWDVERGIELDELALPSKGRSLAFSPDGRYLAGTAGDFSDSFIVVWDAKTRHPLWSTNQIDFANAIAFTPDSRQLLVSGNEKFGPAQKFPAGPAVYVFDIDDFKEVRQLARQQGVVDTFVLSADGGTLVTVSGVYGAVTKWQFATGAQQQTWSLRQWSLPSGKKLEAVTAIAVSSDGSTVAIGAREQGPVYSGAGRMLIANGTQVLEFGSEQLNAQKQKSITVAGLAFDASRLIVAGGGGTVILDATTGKLLRHVDTGDSHQVAFYLARHRMAGAFFRPAGQSSGIRLFDLNGAAPPTTMASGAAIETQAVLAQDGTVYLNDGATIRVWRAEAERQLHVRPEGLSTFACSLVFHSGEGLRAVVSPDGKLFAAYCSSSPEISLWTADGAVIPALAHSFSNSLSVATPSDHYPTGIGVAQFTPDSKFLLIGLNGEQQGKKWCDLRLVDVGSAKLVKSWRAHEDSCYGLSFSGSGNLAMSQVFSRETKMWNSATWAPVIEIGAWESAVSDDGTLLAGRKTGPLQFQLHLWQVATGKELFALGPANLADRTPVPTAWAWRSGTQSLAVAYNDCSLALVNGATGKAIATLAGAAAEAQPDASVVQSLHFSDDGRLLLATRADSNSQLYDMQSNALLRTVYTPGEFAGFFHDGKWIVLDGSSGMAKFISTETGITDLALAHNGDDWLAVSAGGFFDGTAGGWRNILWRFSSEITNVLPVEAFFNDFYFPGLVDEVLGGKRLPSVNIQSADRRQPLVAITSPGDRTKTGDREVEVTLQVSESRQGGNPGSGVRDVRLFRNGALVRVWHDNLPLDSTGRTRLRTTIKLVAGENRLTAYAFNRSNIKSADTTVTVTGADSLQRRGVAYILTVGINQYSNPDYTLHYAVADAQDFSETLQQRLARLHISEIAGLNGVLDWPFEKVQVVPLFDSEATKQNLLWALRRLSGAQESASAGVPSQLSSLHPVQPEDAVFIYFAGHGTAAGQRFYLLPHDVGYTGKREDLDEAAVTMILQHSVSDIELQAAMENIDAGELVMVIDACNSGQALQAEEKRRGPMNSAGLAQLAYEKGMYVLTAAKGYQAAQESTQLGHGLLTYALVEQGLKTAAAASESDMGQVTLRRWLDYATQRVPQMQSKLVEAAQQAGRDLGDSANDPTRFGVQQPRVFYRREPDAKPFIVTKVGFEPAAADRAEAARR